VVGYGDDTYGPRDLTRRDQMASFIMRALDYILETAEVPWEPGDPVTVHGEVTDAETGDPIAGATVTLENGEDYTATTTTDGTYSIADVAPDDYTAAADAEGYDPETEDITVGAEQRFELDFELTPTADEPVDPAVEVLSVEQDTAVAGQDVDITFDATFEGDYTYTLELRPSDAPAEEDWDFFYDGHGHDYQGPVTEEQPQTVIGTVPEDAVDGEYDVRVTIDDDDSDASASGVLENAFEVVTEPEPVITGDIVFTADGEDVDGQFFEQGDTAAVGLAVEDVVNTEGEDLELWFDGARPGEGFEAGEDICTDLLTEDSCIEILSALADGNPFTDDTTFLDDEELQVAADAEVGEWQLRWWVVDEDGNPQFSETFTITIEWDTDSVAFVNAEECDEVTGGTGSSDDPYCDIQVAIDHVGDDGLVFVAEGTYEEDLEIPYNGLTLAPNSAPEIIGSITITGDDVTVDGMRVVTTDDVPRGVAILVEEADGVTLTNNEVEGVSPEAGFTQPAQVALLDATNAHLEGNVVEGVDDGRDANGVLFSGDVADAVVHSNEITGAGGGALGLMVSDADSVSVEGNVLAESSDGLWVWHSDGADIDNLDVIGNTIAENDEVGVKLVAGSTIGAATLSGNEFAGNDVQVLDAAEQLGDLDEVVEANTFDRAVTATPVSGEPAIWSSIQDGIDAADANDATVTAYEGTYEEDMDVQSTSGLTLLGAQSGVSAGVGGDRTAASTEGETIVDGEIRFGGGTPTVSDLTIDGFRLENTGLVNNGARVNGDLVLENLVVESAQTYFLISVGTGAGHNMHLADSTITGERGFSVDNALIDSAIITNNVFHTNAASLVSASAQDGVVDVDGNEFNGPRGINILTNNNTVANNTFNVDDGATSRGLDVYEVTGNDITDNTFNLGAEATAILVREGAREEADLENTIEHNQFNGTTDERGVHNQTEKSVDATANWWGDASGPSGEGEGTGTAVSADVTFVPWCIDPDCAALSSD
jgi:hypothetical protein